MDRSKIATYPVKTRNHQYNHSEFAEAPEAIDPVFLESLPTFSAGGNFYELIAAIEAAWSNGKPIIFMIGGHVIKYGLGPVIVDLMERRVVTHIAMNGATSIHDFEIACFGATSEHVIDLLPVGMWGLWEETGAMMHDAINFAATTKYIGMGAILAKKAWVRGKAEARSKSVLYNAYILDLPVTVHVGIGCDVIHQHPKADGAAIGKTSMRDFENFVDTVSSIGDGGVVINFGSAAVLPEVFSKALNLARNITKKSIANFVTANFDIMYTPPALSRPFKSVVDRPHLSPAAAGQRVKTGRGFNIVGHHEIMIPLLAACIKGRIEKCQSLKGGNCGVED